MIHLSDTNLGPMVSNIDDYVKEMMDQNVSNRKNYEIVTKE